MNMGKVRVICSDHSILECYNLFSGVELSMRSFLLLLFMKTGLGVLNQTYQYPNTEMVFDMILCCHIRADRYQNLKEGRFKTQTRQSALTNLIYTLV